MARGSMKIPVAEIEFIEGGNTIWIHGLQGGTILRIKTMKRITVKRGCDSPIPHADVVTNDPIVVCMP